MPGTSAANVSTGHCAGRRVGATSDTDLGGVFAQRRCGVTQTQVSQQGSRTMIGSGAQSRITASQTLDRKSWHQASQ
eukprot:2142176-Rhodomonas_salina.2